VNTSFDASAIVRGSLLLLGLLVALFFGILIGEANWYALAAIGVCVLVASVAQLTVRHLLPVCLALVMLDFWMAPIGFKISPMEQLGIVVAFAWLLVCWRRNFNPLAPTAFTQLKSWRFFQKVVVIAAAYALAHFVYNMIDPYDELAFGWKGASKSYAQTFGAFFMIVFLARARLLFAINAKYSTGLLWLFFLLLSVSVAIGVARAVIVGPETEMGLTLEEKSERSRLFLIPGLNAYDNIYTLRQLGPAAVLLGSTFFFARPRSLGPFLPLAITSLGFLGCLVSGGRASLLIAVVFMLAAMVHAKRGPLAFGLGGLLAILISILLIIPAAVLKEAPWHAQRSIGWFRPDLRTQATEGIEDSSQMRWRHFKFAWEHYSSGNARLIFFGRSVGQMDYADSLSFALHNELAQMEFGIRRLATHNGMTDFLLGWGLLGYVLNILMCVACISVLIKHRSSFSPNSHGRCWLFSSAVFLSFWLVYTHVGGAFVWPLAIGFVIIALAQVDGLLKNSIKPVEEILNGPAATDIDRTSHSVFPRVQSTPPPEN
jgi:hypothetical protein